MNKFDKVDRIFVMFQAPLAKFSAVAALLFSALPVSGFLCAPDRAGFTRSVSAGPAPSHDIVAVPSTATISALPSGSARFNFAGEPAGDEHAGRTL